MRLIHIALLISLASSKIAAEDKRREFVTVVIPLSFDDGCWSSVSIQNLRDHPVSVDVEAHAASGALLPLPHAPSMPLRLRAAEKLNFRLQPESIKGREAWLKISEAGESRPAVAVSASNECVQGDLSTSAPSGIAYPTRNPWIEGSTADLAGKFLLVLNAGAEPASFEACYSNGAYVTIPAEGSEEPAERPVCTHTRSAYVPPYATNMIPIEREGSSQLRVRTRGDSMILLVLKPESASTKRFSVDSKIVFLDPVSK